MSAPTPDAQPNAARALDEPLADATDDLLDMDQHALALARYISEQKRFPFIVGIFGEWGEGKTTLVQFLEHHLFALTKEQPGLSIKFISFSAWPYTTSEKLWRALILKIAQKLFNKDPEEEPDRKKESATETQSWKERLTSFLVNDFFPRKIPAEAPSDYDTIIKDLEETDFGRISRRTPATQPNQEAMMNAVVNGALTVLGSVSPLVAGLRSLLGEPKVDVQQLAQTQVEENSTEAIQALPKFRKIFQNLLKKKAPGDVVYVFIDDLDRAQPDVALDIMESIRIALQDVDCIFIIAVDDTLISQGLRLRYKELFADVSSAALASKGEEYLEKIIQFRMRVPPRTAEQTKRLIAAEFPDWTPAGDIIQTITNNNPRRIKQYCQRLKFQQAVGSTFRLGSAGAEEAAPAVNNPATPID